MGTQIAEIERASSIVNRAERLDTSMLLRNAERTKPIAGTCEAKEKPVDKQVWSIPGFGAGARVQTSFGLVPVEFLRKGDPIKTRTGHFLRVQYVDTIRLDRRFLLTHPESQPITIPKGAFGANCPSKNICVSGAQEVWQSGRFDQMQGTAAENLLG